MTNAEKITKVIEGIEVTAYIKEGREYYELDDAMEILKRRLKRKENENRFRGVGGTGRDKTNNRKL